MGRDSVAQRQMTLVAFLQAANCSNYAASWRHPATRKGENPDQNTTLT